MYRNCIFCSALLGANELIESFPVGRHVAFDSWKGRLWVVCPRCGRWNLAPLEERWEPVEQAEKHFRDARLRVQRDNVGLARLPDGTRLIRIGKPLPGEIAAWRYGKRLLRRRTKYLAASAATGAVVVAAVASPIATVGTIVAGVTVGGLLSSVLLRIFPQRVIYRSPSSPEVTTPGVIIYPWHIEGMMVAMDEDAPLKVVVRDAHLSVPAMFESDALAHHAFLVWRWGVRRNSKDVVTIAGEPAHALLRRAMVYVNGKGCGPALLESATSLLAGSVDATRFLCSTLNDGFALGARGRDRPQRPARPVALALEMALNEELERRALEGELGVLEAAWREAEVIAAIADSLPDTRQLARGDSTSLP